ncbi:DUF4845 domain-containing protein [Frateuria aurantia]
MRHQQQGLSFISFLLVAAAAIFTIYVGARLLPSYLEYYGFAKALESSADAGEAADTLAAARQRFARSIDSQYVGDNTVQLTDLSVSRDGGAPRLVLTYDKQIHMFYNIDALLHFQKSVPFHGTIDSEAQ